MKVGIITKTNTKGQMVIPKSIRDALGINFNIPLNIVIQGIGFYVYPIKRVVIEAEEDQSSDDSYAKVLDKTRGRWKDEDCVKLMKKRRKIELKASEERKQSW